MQGIMNGSRYPSEPHGTTILGLHRQFHGKIATRTNLLRVATIASLFLLLSCGFVHDETLVGPYKLVAVDISGDMSLCWSSLDGQTCDGIVGPTVFAAGFNEKFVVVEIHPNDKKAITQFFYVIREPENENNDFGPTVQSVQGPFNKRNYEIEKARLKLPEFTRTFDDLK